MISLALVIGGTLGLTALAGEGYTVHRREDVARLDSYLSESSPNAVYWLEQKKRSTRQTIEKVLSSALMNATPLIDFPPFSLITVEIQDPAAGFPGKLSFQDAVVFDVETHAYAYPTLRWLQDYRRGRPLGPSRLDRDRLKSHLTQILQVSGAVAAGGAFHLTVKRVDELQDRTRCFVEIASPRWIVEKTSTGTVELAPDGSPMRIEPWAHR